MNSAYRDNFMSESYVCGNLVISCVRK